MSELELQETIERQKDSVWVSSDAVTRAKDRIASAIGSWSIQKIQKQDIKDLNDSLEELAKEIGVREKELAQMRETQKRGETIINLIKGTDL